MKLRYYLRGLGIGIVVTALLMGVATRDGKPMTDAEIKAKAQQLGMVESDSLRLTDIQPTSAPEPSESEESEQEEPSESEESEPEEPSEPESMPEESSEPENKPEESSEPENKPEESSEPESVSDEPPVETSETITIVVKSGSGSRTVANQLAEAGLVEDGAKYDQYLCDNGYARRICVGTYEIEMGSTEEQIAKIITRTK